MNSILRREQLALVELTASVLSNRSIVRLFQEYDTVDEEISILKSTCRGQARNSIYFVAVMILREIQTRNIMNTYLPYEPKKYTVTSRAFRPLVNQSTMIVIDTDTTKTRKTLSAIRYRFDGLLYRIPIVPDVLKLNLLSTKTLETTQLVKVITTRKDIPGV